MKKYTFVPYEYPTTLDERFFIGQDERHILRSRREQLSLTQQQVADKIGITQRKYSYIETGVQPLTDEILVALSKLYNVSIDYILKQTKKKERYSK